ncbi:MAG: histidinol-phosphatase, partial [Lachnospiraceae bacterium]|nr:histidinol-phosphatase [Lachnospiraceae bacterium]
MNDKIREQYPYLYETHLHTSEGSACARSTGAEMARACKEYGYTGIIVTDHNWYGNTAVDRSLPWEEWLDVFCEGYEHARAEGDRIGLDVFFGYEAGYQGTEFLIYGVDGAWL